jgi:hypothetical protein
MHTARTLLEQVRRALFAVCVLGAFAALLQLVVPLVVLHVLDSVIPTASLDTLALLMLVAVAAAAVLTCIAAARDRIMLRAALWLDHTLGQHMLENGLRAATPPAALQDNAHALARLTEVLSARALLPALDAPWLPLSLLALTLLHPLMGAVAAFAATLLVLAAMAHAAPIVRLAEQIAQAAARTRTWWQSTGLTTGAPGHPGDGAQQWERLNRAHIAAAYALGKRANNARDLARAAQAGAQIALIAVGGWLVMGHELTVAALIAGLLIQVRLLQPLASLVASLDVVGGAISAYRRLEALPADAADPRGSPQPAIWAAADGPTPAIPAPRLNVRGPLAAALIAVLLFSAGLGAAAVARLGDIAELTGRTVFESKLVPVPYPRSGVGTRVHVREGAAVRAGDLLVTLDTAALDRRILALKTQAEAARGELLLVSQAALAMVAAAEPLPDGHRPKLASLEQRIAQLEKQAQDLHARIAIAEQDLAKSEIRAPVSGRVVSLGARGADAAIAPGMTLLEIATADRPLLDRLLDPVLRNLHRSHLIGFATSSAAGRGRGS